MPLRRDRALMQALIATLDAALYGSVATLLGLTNPGILTRRAYNGPEVYALLEGEVFAFVFFDTAMSGYGRDFSAAALAGRYPDAKFCALGGATGMRLDSIPVQPVALAPYNGPRSSRHENSSLAELLHAVGQTQQRSQLEGPTLTGRQRDVLRLVREGKSTKEIARHLELAVPTVKTHLAALYRQLGVRNRVEAAMTNPTPATQVVRHMSDFGDASATRALHLRAVG
ncbi:MAG: response regulator transcription factor [Acetobacteraceae bacterium]|nr:response regulator transcription factor [Acetobacteraceae bacterium]